MAGSTNLQISILQTLGRPCSIGFRRGEEWESLILVTWSITSPKGGRRRPRGRGSRGQIPRRGDSGMERGSQFQEKAAGARGLCDPLRYARRDPALPDCKRMVARSH